jgi:hypothetical protein
VLVRSEPQRVRSDAELFFVVDTSRSMTARESPAAPTRLARARHAAARLRAALPEVPAGIASFTDRVLPHLLPTSDASVFAVTLEDAVGVNRPPPAFESPVATSFQMLAAFPAQGSFSRRAKRRLLVVLTDGESQSYTGAAVAQELRRVRTGLVLVRFWSARDRVFSDGADAGYRPAAASAAPLRDLGRLSAGGRVFGPGEVDAAAAAARTFLGSGPTLTIDADRQVRPLAPWVALAALLPLALVVSRRGGGQRFPLRQVG